MTDFIKWKCWSLEFNNCWAIWKLFLFNYCFYFLWWLVKNVSLKTKYIITINNICICCHYTSYIYFTYRGSTVYSVLCKHVSHKYTNIYLYPIFNSQQNFLLLFLICESITNSILIYLLCTANCNFILNLYKV